MLENGENESQLRKTSKKKYKGWSTSSDKGADGSA